MKTFKEIEQGLLNYFGGKGWDFGTKSLRDVVWEYCDLRVAEATKEEELNKIPYVHTKANT